MADPVVVSIVQCGDPVLRRPAEPVDRAFVSTPEFAELIDVMAATMAAAPGVGLAAPQIGLGIRLAVMRDGPDLWGAGDPAELAARERTELPFTVLVNPEWEPVGDDRVRFFEGCLSVAGLTGIVARHREVRVRALDREGRPFERLYRGWPARIVQHELDHLDGRLYLDRVETRSLATGENYGRFWAGRPVPAPPY